MCLLIGIQEALPLMVDYLKSNLKDYEYWGRGREAEGGGEASGVFYRKNLWKIIDQGHFGCLKLHMSLVLFCKI